MSYWHEVVHRFFNPRAVFRQSIRNEGDEAEKQYEILFPALARYFHTHFESGIKSMQLVLDKGTADRSLHGDYHAIENGKANLIYWFEGGSHVSLSCAPPPPVHHETDKSGSWWRRVPFAFTSTTSREWSSSTSRLRTTKNTSRGRSPSKLPNPIITGSRNGTR